MNEMYSAMPGSPITYLAGDISAGQTTIAVADDTALPDAPNICTIGYGEHIETIRYGAKSNGVLQDVTRGIEGTPRAWQAGTEVARFYTAYEHNKIVDNITVLSGDVGEIGELETEEKGNLVEALNGVAGDLTSHLADIAQTQVAVVNPSGISGAVNYYKSFGVVTISITHSTLQQELNGFATLNLFTLPVGFRPATTVWVPLAFDNGAALAILQISSTTGVVSIYSRQSNAIATNIAFRGSAVFPVAQQ